LLVGVIEQLGSAYISPKARDIVIHAPLLMIPWFVHGDCSGSASSAA
jgi:hypothetical protein